MEWTTVNFLACTLFISVGALVQGVTGLGAGLVAVPMLALVSYSLVPGPLIFASLVLSSLMAFRGRANIDFSNTGMLGAGLLVGTVVAVIYVSRLPLASLGLVFGLLVLLAVAISVAAPPIDFNRRGMLGAGALSGFMGASAGVGGPVLALLYQRKAGPEIRATLAFLYFMSSIIMLVCLHFAGRFGRPEAAAGLLLMPGFLLGYVLAPRLIMYFDKGYTRLGVLIITTASGLALISQSVMKLITSVP